MKKVLLCTFAFILISNGSNAKIWRLNNNFGVLADFTTAQAANDGPAVLAGDTIHIEPSITDYGSLSANKRLVWISIGAFLSAHPGTQYSTVPGTMTSISAFPGSENSVFSIYSTSAIGIYVSSIRVERSYFGNNINITNNGYGNPNNVVVLNSYANAIVINGGSNHIIANNIIKSYCYVSSTGAATITQNVINAEVDGSSSIDNSTLQNNIFNKVTTAYTFTNCIVEYNMSGSAGIIPTGNNNQNAVAMSTVFINNSGNTDGDFILKAGSPALATGIGGVDMGAYGGGSPFKLAVQPAVPSIYKILAPAAPAGNTMNVIFSTRSNN